MFELDDIWIGAIGDHYKKVASGPFDGWYKCNTCREYPRVWEYDNGVHAKCLCSGNNEEAPCRSESILSFVKRNGNSIGYNQNDIRLAWNKYIETGKQQNTLPKGQW